MKRKVSLEAIRKANAKLVTGGSFIAPATIDNSKNGTLIFQAIHFGKSYDLHMSKTKIKEAYSKSLASTISK